MELILGFTTALLISIALTPVFIRFAETLKLVDVPCTDRHVHTDAIPRVGGLGIVLATFASIGYWYESSDYLWVLFSGGAVIALFGLLDDRFNLSHRWKFFGQILAILLTLSGGVLISTVPFMGLDAAPLWISYPLTFLFILGVINAVNLSDGLDGLAAGTILLSLGLVAVFALRAELLSLALIALGVMGAVLGFLRYNTHPARVFMGDTGSQFLGYIIACLAILVTQDVHTPLNPVLPLFIVGLPILDTLLVMMIRRRAGKPLFAADKSHIHHQLLRIGFQQYQVVAILYGIQASFVLLAWNLRYSSDMLLLCVYLSFSLLIVGSISLAQLKGWRIQGAEVYRPNVERRNRWLRKLSWLHRYGGVILEALLSALLVLAALAYCDPQMHRGWVILASVSVMLLLLPLLIRPGPTWLTRVLCYTAAIFVASAMCWRDDQLPVLDHLFDAYLILIAIMLALCIRVTRRSQFRLDTQDLLVLFLVLVLPLLPFENIDRYELGHIAVRLAVLFYTCEYVMSTARGQTMLLRGASVMCLFIMLVYG